MSSQPVVVVAAAALTVGCLLTAAPAHADDSSFLAHMRALGFTDGTAAGYARIVDTGYTVCHALEAGNSISSVRDLGETILGAKGAPAAVADKFVSSAIRDLCPADGGDPS